MTEVQVILVCIRQLHLPSPLPSLNYLGSCFSARKVR